MRLHLPKRLLRAVLTALVTTSAALLGLGSTAYAGFYVSTSTFYLNGNNEKDFNQDYSYLNNTQNLVTGMWSNQYGTYQNGKYTLYTDPSDFADSQLIKTISTGDRVSATIETLNVTNNKSLSIGVGGNGVFTGGGLVIEKFKIENSGTATLSVGEENECHKVTINSVTGTLNISNYSNLTFAGGESAINLGTVALNSGSITNTGTLNLTEAVSMTEAYVRGNIMGDLATGTKNGFGTFSSIALSDLFKGGGTVTVGDSVSWTMGGSALTYSADSQSFSLANALISTVYQVHSNYTIGSDVNSATSIQVYGTGSSTTTLTLSSSLPNTVKAIVANEHTVFNIDGTANGNYELILNGGTLTNTGAEENVGKTKAQLCKMSVTADSVITANDGHSFGFVASQYGATDICLNGHTLTKNGTGEFFAASTTLHGGGTLKIEKGTFTLGFNADNTDRIGFLGHEADSVNTNVWLTGGTLDGIFTVQRDAEIKAEGGAGNTVSAKITLAGGKTATFKATGSTDRLSVTNILSGSGSVSVTGGGTVELSGTNTYTGGTKLSGGHLTVGNDSALGRNTGVNNQVLSFSGTSTLTVSTGITLAATGKIQASEAKAALDISGNVNLTGQINVADKVGRVNITEGTTSLLGNDGRIWLVKDSAVTISKGANLVTRVFSFTGNKDVSAGEITSIGDNKIEVVENAGVVESQWSKNTDYINTNFKDLDVEYRSTGDRVVKADMHNVALSTAAGAGKLTLAREGGVTLTGLTANSDVELATATKVTGITNIKQGATLSVSDAQSSLNKLSGSGKLSASVNQTLSLNTDTNNPFAGTLETTNGKLNVTGGTEYVHLAGMVADGGNLDLLSSAIVTVSDVTIGSDSTVGVYKGTTASPTEEGKVAVHGFPSAKAQLTVGTGAKLNADLSLSNAILTFNGDALTLGSSLTLQSGNELQGSLYSNWDGSGTLDLFTGVDSLTLGSGDTAITAEVGKTYDASSVFANEGMDNYKLQIVGSTKNYTVQMVKNAPTPEPTTATLSLLALMGLAARRRRKA